MTINGWAWVNVYDTQFSQVPHLSGNALVSLWMALIAIRTLAKSCPGEEGAGRTMLLPLDDLRWQWGGPKGTELYWAPSTCQELS